MNEKELAKELCENSTCHHKCPDTDKCIVEDEALLLINQNKSNNFDVKSNNVVIANSATTTEKQIEEMAKAICEICKCDGDCDATICSSAFVEAEHLYNAGYRKQIEGEWIKINPNNLLIGEYYCSCCNSVIDIADGKETPLDREMYYCPNCGSKMKGGAE